MKSLISEVSDGDICWATDLLGLHENAFRKSDGDNSRIQFLKNLSDIDVEACPGSGKTTLLVAKLAILANKWEDQTRGVCVLSHTNAARREIEQRLSGHIVGQSLLSFPHFVGTIHAFVDQFLALPWLRSIGIPVKLINTEICERRRWQLLDYGSRLFLEKKRISPSQLRLSDTSFTPSLKGKTDFPSRPDTKTYKNVQAVLEEIARNGYHCFDDMFVWSNDLIDKIPAVVETIRDRFPILFIDEAQDNNELQSSFLHRVFSEGETPVTRQRLGDGNQAIYDFGSAEEAKTDKFPNEVRRLRLPHSYRFTNGIADLVDSFGINPYGMKGLHDSLLPKRHTVFVFDQTRALEVLEHYAKLLVKSFTHNELRDGTFTAVGQIHRPVEGSTSKKHPHFLAHYWPPYEPTLAGAADWPNTFLQYVIGSQSKASLIGEVFVSVEGLARGILRLSSILSGQESSKSYPSAHRQIVDLLSGNKSVLDEYFALSQRYALELTPLIFSDWEKTIRPRVVRIAEAISGSDEISGEANDFLSWKDNSLSPAVHQSRHPGIVNYFAYPSDDPLVRIRVGSIHAAKGETHTATLVLDTYWYDHNLSALKQWLIGRQSGHSRGDGKHNFSRLKTHYVAMTRPSDLLCLAINKKTFENEYGEMNQEEIRLLEERGWDVVLIDGVPEENDDAPC